MGIRKKRKEMIAMKRLTILSLTIAFAMSTLAAAPVSFAAKNTDDDAIEVAASYTEKDTDVYKRQI